MKFFVFIYLAVAVLGLSNSSQIEPDQVQAVIESYVRQISSSLRMSRGGALNLQCYEKYIPQISSIAENGKTDTEACTTRANSRKDDELAKVTEQRSSLDKLIKGVQSYLEDCSAKTDVIVYLSCLKENANVNEIAINTISSTSTSLSTALGQSYVTIENAENTCIASVIDKSKQDTDQLFAALQRCLINGLEDPEPATSEPDVQPEEPQPEEPQPEEPQPEEPQPEEPQPEEPQPEEPQPEEPQPEEPQPEEPQPEEPQPEEPQPEEPQPEEHQPEEPQPEEPQPEEPQPEEPQPEEPQPEEPQPEEPQPEELQPEEPQPEEPQPEEPAQEEDI